MRKATQTLICMDSGVGGLAVLNRFVEQLPGSPYVFLGDTAWMPYGEKPLEVVGQRVREVHQWLHQTYKIAAFVLACNTATVATYDKLQAMNLPYPILEPVKTTAEWVNDHVTPGQKIGILATPGTVSSQRYLQFLDNHWDVRQVACTGLASTIESGICEGKALDEVLLPFLNPLLEWGADVILLGCTHYSLIQEAIARHAGPRVQLVDSAEVLAQTAIPAIQALNLSNGVQRMMVTGDEKAFSQAMRQLPLPALQNKPVLHQVIAETLDLPV